MTLSTHTPTLWLALLFFCLGHSQTKMSDFPEEKENLRRFYLIGDAGHRESSPALQALRTFLRGQEHQEEDFIVFLGDNLPALSELPGSGAMTEVKEFPGRPLFIPGEMEWNWNGIDGLKKTEEFLEERFDREEVFLPKPGCPFSFVDLSDQVHLIVLNTQWFLTDWSDHPLINDDCPEIKTREGMFVEIETELKKNQNKTTIFALHHPLESQGVHGGKLGWSSTSLGVPVLGHLVDLVRTSGGISKQDRGNPKYRKLVDRLEVLANKWGKVVFVSGHEHSLQYLEKGHIKQVIAGSGSGKTYVRKGLHADFTAEKEGFAVLDVFKDGSSWIRFYGSSENRPHLLYETEIFAARKTYDTTRLPEQFSRTVEASVYTREETDRSKFYKRLWGDRYRKLYHKSVAVPVADLDTLYGGLEPVRSGGGHQTHSLRVRDSAGREYNFRKLRKDPSQFLQATAYKEEPLDKMFEGTFAEAMIQDFFTASHPYAFLAIPVLADAAAVYHTNPEIYYLPKQKKLGDFNRSHGDVIYMIEERPEEHWLDYESFGEPNHDIQSTAGMFDRLRRDEKYKLNEAAYIRARIFDMLIGDWDRHNDQWRWAEIEQENGDRIFEPIPRDRDQVFSNFDGLVFDKLRRVIGFFNQFGKFDPDISDVEWFNRSAANLDRVLLENSGRSQWIEQAEFLQKEITDEVISEAFAQLPKEVQGESTEHIMENLKGRRANLVKIITEYYDQLSDVAILTGTDKDDYVDVERLRNGDTRVRITRNKDGERAEVVNERVFKEAETKEIWIYGLDDDDQFFVKGKSNPDILVRLIGGQNNDVYTIEEGAGIRVYDYKSKPNTIEKNNGARIFRTDNYKINVFDKNLKLSHTKSLVPYVGYNPDNGLILGFRTELTRNGLVRKPFTSRHALSGGFFSATEGFEVAYEGEFAHPALKYNFTVGGHYSSPKNTMNFFGLGNETPNPDDEYSKDYNRIRVHSLGAKFGLVKRGRYGSRFSYNALFQGIEVEATEGRFISEAFPENADFFDKRFYGGLEGQYRYQSLNSTIAPSKGLDFSVTAGGKWDLEQTDKNFYYLNPSFELFTPISANRRLVLNPRLQAEMNFREEFAFYHAASLGGNNNLRSFRHERFTGTKAFASSTDLRYDFKLIKNRFLPVQIGVLAGYDVGRVWISEESSNTWHQSYGGGLWLAVAKAAAAELNLFHGKEGFRFSFEFQMGL